MGLGFKAGYLGLHDPNLLPYSLCVTTYTLLGQLLYRPVNPVVPAITELTPTLASLAYFIRPSMYDSVPPVVPGGPPNPCDTAYRINAAFLAFQFVILAANVLNFGVQSKEVAVERVRRAFPHPRLSFTPQHSRAQTQQSTPRLSSARPRARKNHSSTSWSGTSPRWCWPL